MLRLALVVYIPTRVGTIDMSRFLVDVFGIQIFQSVHLCHSIDLKRLSLSVAPNTKQNECNKTKRRKTLSFDAMQKILLSNNNNQTKWNM